jgi:hypothetical protein
LQQARTEIVKSLALFTTFFFEQKLFTTFLVSEIIGNHGGPLKSDSLQQPLYFQSGLMHTLATFMDFYSHFSLIIIQAFKQQSFGRSTIKLIIDQSILKCKLPNTFISSSTWIT